MLNFKHYPQKVTVLLASVMELESPGQTIAMYAGRLICSSVSTPYWTSQW